MVSRSPGWLAFPVALASSSGVLGITDIPSMFSLDAVCLLYTEL